MTKALIIIDLQTDVLADEGTWDAAGVVERSQQLAERAREASVPVLWVQHSSDEMPRESEGWKLAAGLSPRDDEPIVHKRYFDAFEETELEELLEDASELIICGAQTDFCIRSTVNGALVRGFNVTLVGDAHTGGEIPAEYTGGEFLSAKTKINFMNHVIGNAAKYPSHSGRVVNAAEVDFAS